MNLQTGWTKELDDTAAATVAMDDPAYRDAFYGMQAEIPDPVLYARYLPLEVVVALLATPALRVEQAYIRTLRTYGLAEYGGSCLTVFGQRVRQALREDEA